jgi:hypothetical protein
VDQERAEVVGEAADRGGVQRLHLATRLRQTCTRHPGSGYAPAPCIREPAHSHVSRSPAPPPSISRPAPSMRMCDSCGLVLAAIQAASQPVASSHEEPAARSAVSRRASPRLRVATVRSVPSIAIVSRSRGEACIRQRTWPPLWSLAQGKPAQRGCTACSRPTPRSASPRQRRRCSSTPTITRASTGTTGSTPDALGGRPSERCATATSSPKRHRPGCALQSGPQAHHIAAQPDRPCVLELPLLAAQCPGRRQLRGRARRAAGRAGPGPVCAAPGALPGLLPPRAATRAGLRRLEAGPTHVRPSAPDVHRGRPGPRTGRCHREGARREPASQPLPPGWSSR